VRELHQKGLTGGHICIMDASLMTFQVPIAAKFLCERWNCSYKDLLNHEFLVYGKIVNNGEYEVASYKSLVDAGLFKFLPELNDNKDHLASWMNSWRGVTFPVRSRNSIRDDIMQARLLGECFGSRLALPATLAFLCMRERPAISDREFWQQLRHCLHDLEVPLMHYKVFSGSIPAGGKLREVSQFVRLMKKVKWEDREGAWEINVDMDDITGRLGSMQSTWNSELQSYELS
jgi:hypothetical protein